MKKCPSCGIDMKLAKKIGAHFQECAFAPILNAPETVVSDPDPIEFPDDPWKHRSVGMRCSSCMWFAPKSSPLEDVLKLGRCRRHAPAMDGYPVVFPTDWCGDHKLDENKA